MSESKWQGEGWYTFEQWDSESESFVWPESMTEAEWVESKYDFDDFSEVPEGIESVVTYYGNGDIPTDGMKVSEACRASFTPEQEVAYAKAMGETFTTIGYDVRYQFDGNANIEGAPYDTLEEAREAYESELSVRDSRTKTVWLVKTECDYEGDECVEVRDVETIETRTI